MGEEKALRLEGDLYEDESIMKEIIKAGTGDEMPGKGAQVNVHYVGTLLDGTKFDSSRDRGDTFNFKLGVGSVIKGWDQGVATMKKGELAKFTIKGDKAYGERGSPPKIPPNATLVFEVELISWTDHDDISEARDQGIMKKVLTEGNGYLKPADLSHVTITYKMTLEDGTVVKEGTDEKFVIDDGTLLPGFETFLKSMAIGETAKGYLQPSYAFGSKGDEALKVPANAVIKVEATLVALEKDKDQWNSSKEEKLEEADKKKEMGNTLFKSGDYERASRRYKTALNFLTSYTDFSDEEKKLGDEKKTSLYLNYAMCQLKLGKHSEAIKQADEALKLDKDNVKGLFRKGSAQLEMGQYDEAKKNFKRVLELDEANKPAASALKKIKAKAAQDAAKSKALYGKMGAMFAKSAKAAEEPKKEEKSEKSTEEAAEAPTASE